MRRSRCGEIGHKLTTGAARAEALAHDAFEPKFARVPEDDLARFGDVLIELQPSRCVCQQAGQRTAASSWMCSRCGVYQRQTRSSSASQPADFPRTRCTASTKEGQYPTAAAGGVNSLNPRIGSLCSATWSRTRVAVAAFADRITCVPRRSQRSRLPSAHVELRAISMMRLPSACSTRPAIGMTSAPITRHSSVL
jgi:hypothetical protein